VSSNHLRGLRPDFHCSQTVAALLMWGALSDEINGLPFTIAAQSFLGPSPTGIVTILYCLRFEIPPTWRARSPYLYLPGTGWRSYTPRYWVPFSSSSTTRRAMVEVFEPASTRVTQLQWSGNCLQDNSSARTTQKTRPLY
jgi:hypothetical protein